MALAALWAGILGGRFHPPGLDLPPGWAVWAAAFGLLLLWLILLRRIPRPRTFLPLAAFFLAGLGLILPHEQPLERLPAKHILHLAGEQVIIQGTLVQPPRQREWGTYLVVEAQSVLVREGEKGPRRERPAQGRVRLFLNAEAGSWPNLAYGSRIRFQTWLNPIRDFANQPPGGYLFSFRRYLADRSIHLRGSLRNPAALMLLPEPGGWGFWRLVEGGRARVQGLIRKSLPPPQAGLLRAVLLGDQDGLAREVQEAFQKTGMAHLLVVSGLHLTMVAFLAGFLLRFLLTRRTDLCLRFNLILLSRLLALVPVLAYALLSGLSIPTWRAFILVATAWSALALSRRLDGLSALALAGLIVTLFWPPALFDTGFQLSFTAVAVLIWLGSLLEKALRIDPAGPAPAQGRLLSRTARRGFNYLAGLAASSVLMALFLAPLLALHFGRVPLLGAALNIILIPLYTLAAVPLGLAGVGLGLLQPLAGGWLLGLAGQAAQAGAGIALGAAGWNFGGLRVTGLTVPEVLLIYGVLAGTALALGGKPRRRGAALALACLVLLAGDAAFWHHRGHDARLEATVLDVGQGASILLRLPGGERWLIDGGYASPEGFDLGRVAVAPALWARKISRIGTLVASHPQADHYGGLGHILKEFEPARFIHPGHPEYPRAYAELLKEVERAGLGRVTLSQLRRGLTMGRVEIKALWPPPGFASDPKRPDWFTDPNQTSLVLKVTHGRVRLLFTADIESRAERELCRLHDQGLIDLAAEILYLPHHGSNTSTSGPFLERVRPELALASCGDAGPPRPHPRVLERLGRAGVRVLSTNDWGALTVASDGEAYRVRTALARPRRAVR